MISLDYLKTNLEEYKKNLINRQLKAEDFKLEKILELSEQKKSWATKIQDIERARN